MVSQQSSSRKSRSSDADDSMLDRRRAVSKHRDDDQGRGEKSERKNNKAKQPIGENHRATPAREIPTCTIVA